LTGERWYRALTCQRRYPVPALPAVSGGIGPDLQRPYPVPARPAVSAVSGLGPSTAVPGAGPSSR